MTKEELEQACRDEMVARKTRHYKQKVLRECVAGVITFMLVITFLVMAMAVFPD